MKNSNFILVLIIFFLSTSCVKEKQKKIVESTQSKFIDTLPKIIKFKNSKAVIFPAPFTKRYRSDLVYFTPDEKTIRYVEKRLPETQNIIDKFWGESDWQKLLKFDAKQMGHYDKQYLGVINSKKDSIVAIFLYNFESDPNNLKQYLEKKLISGGDGWFNTNTCRMEYNIQSKKFALDFD